MSISILIFLQESQYAKWLAATRLAAKGKTMADSGFDAEFKSIMAFLSMQHPASQPAINPATLDINVEDYVASRFLRKVKSKVDIC
jgi:kindlin 2